jgi:ABC-type dipeptide/oligopeptide/nickel transport system permease subunit
MSTDVGTLAEAPVGGGVPEAVVLKARAVRLPRSPKVIAGVLILLVFIVMTVVGPWIAPYDPSSNAFPPNLHPSATHWLGTTSLGQDIWSQLLNGARATMVVGFVAGLAATVLSVVVGVAAGYLGGVPDEGLSLLSNVFLAIPGLPLLIVIDSYLPPGGRSNAVLIGVVISLTGWAYGARIMRAQTLSLRKRDFVESARIAGEGRSRIIFFEVVPNLLAIIASSFLFTMLYAIGAYVALAYLGLTSTAVWNWGTMLYWAQANNAPLTHQWWWFVPPGMCIALVGTGLALLNFGIDEFINPRLRAAGLSRRGARKAGLPRHTKLGVTPVVRTSAPSAGAAGGAIAMPGRARIQVSPPTPPATGLTGMTGKDVQ